MALAQKVTVRSVVGEFTNAAAPRKVAVMPSVRTARASGRLGFRATGPCPARRIHSAVGSLGGSNFVPTRVTGDRSGEELGLDALDVLVGVVQVGFMLHRPN